MRDEQRKLLRIFAGKVRQKYPEARIWAFGSHVRGTATAESDLDICVVLSHLEPEDRISISDIAWEVGFEHEWNNLLVNHLNLYGYGLCHELK
jgi:predicted nucleotidyltransferase